MHFNQTVYYGFYHRNYPIFCKTAETSKNALMISTESAVQNAGGIKEIREADRVKHGKKNTSNKQIKLKTAHPLGGG